MKFSTMEKEVNYITQTFTEWAATYHLNASNSHSGHELPYKWKIWSDDPFEYYGAISIDASEVTRMQVMSEVSQREFLYSKFVQAFIVPAT